MISDEELLAYVRPSTNDDLPELRRLERAAVGVIQKKTGRYFGVVGEVTEFLTWRGWPMQLANTPDTAEDITLEKWESGAWVEVGATEYAIHGTSLYWETSSTSYTPTITRYRITYTAGYADTNPEEWDAPEEIKQAALLYVTYYFDKRDGEDYDTFSRAFNDLCELHTRVVV